MNQTNNPQLNNSNTIESVEVGEKIVATISRHAFGIIKSYFLGILLLLAIFVMLYFSLLGDAESANKNYSNFVLLTLAATTLVFVFLVVLTIIYYQSKLIITDENLIRISQSGLFGRHSSQIFLGDIEDVSSTQNGFFATFFDFGILKVETESEQRNFIFTYCPKTQIHAKLIIDAKENYLAKSTGSIINSKTITD